MFAFVSAPLATRLTVPIPLLVCSLGSNNLTNNGKDMSGLLKLVEILPQTKIESLRCAPAPKCLLLCQRPLTEKQTPLCAHRLYGNYLGPKGGAALAEGLKGNSTLQLLE